MQTWTEILELLFDDSFNAFNKGGYVSRRRLPTAALNPLCLYDYNFACCRIMEDCVDAVICGAVAYALSCLLCTAAAGSYYC